MKIPWRSAEAMHWQLGEQEMSMRANAPVFQPLPSRLKLRDPVGRPAGYAYIRRRMRGEDERYSKESMGRTSVEC